MRVTRASVHLKSIVLFNATEELVCKFLEQNLPHQIVWLNNEPGILVEKDWGLIVLRQFKLLYTNKASISSNSTEQLVYIDLVPNLLEEEDPLYLKNTRTEREVNTKTDINPPSAFGKRDLSTIKEIYTHSFTGSLSNARNLYKTRAKNILGPWLPERYENININAAGGTIYPFSRHSSNSFNIYIFSVPNEIKTQANALRPVKVFDHELNQSAYRYYQVEISDKMSESDYLFIKDEYADRIVGQVDLELSSLYIYTNITYGYGTEPANHLVIFEEYLKKLVEILKKYAPREDNEESIENLKKTQFISASRRRYAESIASVDSEINNISYKIRDKAHDLTRLIEQRNKLQRFLALHDLDLKEQIATLSKEYESMLKLDKIETYKFTTDSFIIYTDVLRCKDPRTNKLHEIGKFKITVPYTYDKDIVWENITRKVLGYRGRICNAPHIFNNDVCLGDTEQTFASLRGNYDYIGIVTLAIAFVENVDTSDVAGKLICNWPEVGDIGTTNPDTGEIYT